MKNWHEIPAKEVMKSFAVDEANGLSSDKAKQLLSEYGKNQYAETKRESVFVSVLRQFRDVANIILLLAGFLALALAIREGHGYIEPIVIFAIIFMNIALAVSQERSAERALEALQSLNSPTCLVLRDGNRFEVDGADVVPGDILLLKTGDHIAADARIISGTDLYVDESSLTGESEPVEKDANALPEHASPLGDRINMVFSGCLITAGNATAVVVETGMNTQMGKIAGYLNNAQKIQTPLQKRLNKVSHMISIVAIAAAVLLIVLGLQHGEDFWTMMLAAVSLAVAAVPETLQLIVTLALTQGVKNMVERNALIRKLAAVETLGNTSVICSDKTGTLTQNRMSIQKLWIPDGDPFDATDAFDGDQRRFLQHLALASNATIERDSDGIERIVGDATESAILRLLMEKGEARGELMSSWPRVGEVAFSSSRKMMTTVHKCPEGGYLVLTKGAFDRLPYASAREEERAKRIAVHDGFAKDALRMIALGSRKVAQLPEGGNLEELEQDLAFEGIIGLMDPPRQEAADAIAMAKRAGIRTVMITGDHAATAKAIAKQIGLLGEGERVITGRQLSEIDDDTLIENVRDYSVYARVSPEDKIRIVEAWQENGEVAAMTGDGVNDAPALKAADVGVAMGIAGTEVAKCASDMVLTDDNYATIVAAVREGRTVFGNIRKTIYFLLVCNLSEIVIMLAAQLLGWGIPLTPIMLLLINVLGDGVPGLRLAHERSDSRIMKRKPIGREESFFGNGLMRVIVQQTIAFSAVGLGAYYCGAFLTLSDAHAPSHLLGQTLAFLVIAYTSIVHIFTVRSRKSIFRTPIKNNMPLLYGVVAMLAVFSLFVALPFLHPVFGVTAIGGLHWMIVAGLSVLPTAIAEISKLWGNRHEMKLYRKRLVHHTLDADI